AEGLGAVGKIAEDHAEQVASAVPADALQLGGQQGRRGEPLLEALTTSKAACRSVRAQRAA
ncbi:MAG: hypothetical protein H0T66_00735, partial [Geodermatophilaceae bacterium]|nr:hypothetical protein [Geodermatophilaceae bacterium]